LRTSPEQLGGVGHRLGYDPRALDEKQRRHAPLTFPAVRAIVQEIFTALLLAQQPHLFTRLQQLQHSTYESDKVVLEVGQATFGRLRQSGDSGGNPIGRHTHIQ
jgi:hypothetical protein